MVIFDPRDVGKLLLPVVHYPLFLTKFLDSEGVQEHIKSVRTVDDLINYGIMVIKNVPNPLCLDQLPLR